MDVADIGDYGCGGSAENRGTFLYLVTAMKLKGHRHSMLKAVAEAPNFNFALHRVLSIIEITENSLYV